MRMSPSFYVRPIRHLGAGGIGTVDEVEVVRSSGEPPVGTRLARKQLGAQWSGQPSMRERFEREIQLLASMDHPNIVTLVGVSTSAAERWYVMPLYDGSLRDMIQRYPSQRDPGEVAAFGMVLARALTHAHAKGFVHRDLKPENILLRGEGEAVIADWGVGQFVHRTSKVLDLTVGGLGTSYYCSAEQWAEGRCDARADVYSLGVMLAEVAAGSRVAISPVGAGIRGDVVASTTRAGVRFNSVIKKMTGVVPSMRHQTMSEVAAALEQVRS